MITAHPFEDFLSRLAEEWRGEATQNRRRGQESVGVLIESLADELEESIRAWLDKALTLRESAEFCALAYSTLAGMVRDGVVPNAGEKGRPRIQRRYLPWKGGYLSDRAAHLDADAEPTGRDPNDPAAELIAREISALEEGSGASAESSCGLMSRAYGAQHRRQD